MRATRIAACGGAAALVTAALLSALPASGQTVAASRPAVPSGTAADSTLAHDLAAARTATAKYATNLAKARADGYQIITMMMPNMGYHFLNPKISGFSVRKPPILVYEHTGHGWQLGALEWVFTSVPKNPPLPDATFGSFPAACHYKDGTFVPQKNAATCPKKAPKTGAAFFFWHPKLITMHVCIWYPNPSGLYASTNPFVAPFNNG
jgi:hypothetical protein